MWGEGRMSRERGPKERKEKQVRKVNDLNIRVREKESLEERGGK
jgi:hypothetical protein